MSTDIKLDLEREARLRNTSVSALLDMAAREWLNKSRGEIPDAEEQRRLHAAAAESIGVLAGRNPRRAETARDLIRKRLSKRYGR